MSLYPFSSFWKCFACVVIWCRISGLGWHFELSITSLMRRARWGWDEVNKWQTNKKEGGPLFCHDTCLLGGIRPRCVMGNSWWMQWLWGSRWGGFRHSSLHTAVLAIQTPLTFDLVTRWYTFCRNVGWLAISLPFSFPVASVFTYSFTSLLTPPCPCLKGIFSAIKEEPAA